MNTAIALTRALARLGGIAASPGRARYGLSADLTCETGFTTVNPVSLRAQAMQRLSGAFRKGHAMTALADDSTVVQRILDHIDNRTTDVSDATWREPVEHYRSEARFADEIDRVLRRYPTPFCPSAALPG